MRLKGFTYMYIFTVFEIPLGKWGFENFPIIIRGFDKFSSFWMFDMRSSKL